jgi:hypothetical protein
VIALLVGFACAAALDWLSCAWQEARDRGDLWVGIPVAMVLESVAIVPTWLTIREDNVAIALAAVVGAGVGTAIGFRRSKARRVPNP